MTKEFSEEVEPSTRTSQATYGEKSRTWYAPEMDEGRKRTLLIAACILAARKLEQWDGRPSPALESFMADAITMAEKIMRKIDARWPTENPLG